MDRPTSLDEWTTLLQERSLPLLKNSCETLRQLDYDNISTTRVSNIALTDPGLTLAILRNAAQKPSKRLQGEILTIDAAAMILGISAMVKLIEEMRFLETSTDAHTQSLYMQLVNRTYHGAYQAYGMARIRVDAVPEEIFTAAILQEVGALMLLMHGGGTLNAELIADEGKQIEAFGFTLKQLSRSLTKAWNLSAFIQHSLQDEIPENSPRLYEIHLASNIAHAAERGWESEEMTQLIEASAHHLHLDINDAMREIRDSAVHSAEETLFYGVTPAAASLPGLSDEQRVLLQPAITMISSGAVNHSTTTGIKAARNDEALAAAIHEIEMMLADAMQLPKFMALLKIAFHNALGLNQAFFAMISQDRKYLVSRFVFGSERGFRNLRVPIIHGNLFERLLEKPQALWVKDDNRHKVLPLIPIEFYKLIDVDEFFAMTIRIKGKPLGVVYGDRHGNDHPLDEVDYEKFRQLCLLLAKGFEQLGR